MEQEVKKIDEEILFPNVKVGDIVVKPWSFGKLFDISVILERVIDKAEKKGLITDLNSMGSTVPYTTIAKLFAVAGPDVLELISSTVDVDKEKIKALDMTTGVKIAVIIYRQNKETIKNALALLFSEEPKQNQGEGEEEGTKNQ